MLYNKKRKRDQTNDKTISKKAKKKKLESPPKEAETKIEKDAKQIENIDNTVIYPEDAKSISEFRVSKEIVKNLAERGITKFFPIQEKSFDTILEGKDVLGRARTGTGKTLAFALPLIEKILKLGSSLSNY